MSRGPADPLAQWDQAIGVAPAKDTMAPPRLTLRPHPEDERARPDALYRFFEGRKISRETVDALGVYAWPWAFPGEIEPGPSLVFPTRWKGRDVARTYRHRSGERYDHEHSAEAALFNADAIDTPDTIVWASQALGVAVLMEVGYPQSVAIESGEAEDRRYLALDTHAEMLAKAGKIYLALDDTDADRALREELARRLGRHRCWLVTWPGGCSSPAATLAHLGPDALREAIETAEAYPIQGVQVLREDTLLGLRRREPPATMTTGCGTANEAVRIPTEGRIIIVTGIPGHGKSSWVRFVMVHQMEHYDRKWAVFSPEMEPWEEFAASCAEVFHRKLFWPDPKMPLIPSMTDEEILAATHWFRRRLYMLVSDSEDQAPTLDWWLEKVRELILRYGITDALIDPWNEMDHSRGGLTTAEYISRSLQRLNAFARRHGVNVWIVNHPHSLKPPQRGGKIEAPGIYDMDGGAAWANKGALIITIHRPPVDESPHTQLLVRKAKFRRLGARGNMAEMAFDAFVGTYSTPTG